MGKYSFAHRGMHSQLYIAGVSICEGTPLHTKACTRNCTLLEFPHVKVVLFPQRICTCNGTLLESSHGLKPQAFLSLDFRCRDDVSEFKRGNVSLQARACTHGCTRGC